MICDTPKRRVPKIKTMKDLIENFSALDLSIFIFAIMLPEINKRIHNNWLKVRTSLVRVNAIKSTHNGYALHIGITRVTSLFFRDQNNIIKLKPWIIPTDKANKVVEDKKSVIPKKNNTIVPTIALLKPTYILRNLGDKLVESKTPYLSITLTIANKKELVSENIIQNSIRWFYTKLALISV